jgi:sigma-70-like protein
MSQRRSQAVRRRVTARRNLKTVATRPAWAWQQPPDEACLDEDGMDAALGEEVGRDLPWQSADVSETVVEALVTEEPSRREPTAGVDDAGTPGTERLIRLYLQEAGTVPLLTAADEVRLAEQLRTAKAHLLETLQAARPSAATPPELTPEAWLTERLRQLQRWVASLDQGQAAAVEADSGLPPPSKPTVACRRPPCGTSGPCCSPGTRGWRPPKLTWSPPTSVWWWRSRNALSTAASRCSI